MDWGLHKPLIGAWVALCLSALQLAPGAAAAQDSVGRVLWIDVDDTLLEAAQTALSAFRHEAIALHAGRLNLPRSPAQLRALAKQRAANAVIWTLRQDGQATLYVYDARNDAIVGARRLPAQPWPAATAAAVALSVKTYLRHGAAQPRTAQPASQPARSRAAAPEASRSAQSAPAAASQGDAHRPGERKPKGAAKAGVSAAAGPPRALGRRHHVPQDADRDQASPAAEPEHALGDSDAADPPARHEPGRGASDNDVITLGDSDAADPPARHEPGRGASDDNVITTDAPADSAAAELADAASHSDEHVAAQASDRAQPPTSPGQRVARANLTHGPAAAADRTADAEPWPLPHPGSTTGPAARFLLAAVGGARVALVGLGPELRFGVSAIIQPERPLGVGIRVSSGSGFRVRDGAFSLRLSDPIVAAAGVWRPFAGRSWSVAVTAGPELHALISRITWPAARSDSALRFSPHLQAGLGLTWSADHFFVALWAASDLALLRQRYWVGAQRALETRRLAFTTSIAVGAAWPPARR